MPYGNSTHPDKHGDRDAIARAILEHADAVNRLIEFLRANLSAATKSDLAKTESRLLDAINLPPPAVIVSEKTSRLANRLQAALNKLDATIPDK